ncbi:MAG: CotH kinase family protein [Saprospiraceae bacterium]|nr:CotH kinase family protein [Saprospiraceae bacterium]
MIRTLLKIGICTVCILGIFLDLSAQMPTISIEVNGDIPDEPKVPANFSFVGVDGEVISGVIGIETRGGFSQSNPKKTYDIEFWTDASGSDTKDVQFANLREDDDWILDAMYNEPLRINSFITHKLWLDLNVLYYQDEEPKAKSGADVMYVKVSINGDYQGIYLLSEQVDRSQLKLKKNTNTEIKGELYKSFDNQDAVFFNHPGFLPSNNSLTWSGYEYRYPNDIIDWTNVEELIDFVANSSENEFVEEVSNRFDVDNLMDYFLLLNIARILDNRGKNIYLCRYDEGEPYFLTPWDLDGSWGLLWDGSNDSITEGILSNNLYDRLIESDADGFRQKVSDQWKTLRTTLFSNESIKSRITNAHQFLLSNSIYTQESGPWEYTYSESDLTYMMNWIDARLAFLDSYFDAITDTNDLNSTSNITFYPNPAINYIILRNVWTKNQSFQIYSMEGRLQKSGSLTQLEDQISISDLESGMYILAIAGNSSRFYKL